MTYWITNFHQVIINIFKSNNRLILGIDSHLIIHFLAIFDMKKSQEKAQIQKSFNGSPVSAYVEYLVVIDQSGKIKRIRKKCQLN